MVYKKKKKQNPNLILWPKKVSGRTWMQSIIHGYLNMEADLIGKLQVFNHFYPLYVNHERRQKVTTHYNESTES